jgi:hypothetical protein
VDTANIGNYETTPLVEIHTNLSVYYLEMLIHTNTSLGDRLTEAVFPESDGVAYFFGTEYDDKMSIFEKTPTMLPEYLKYIPRHHSEISRLKARIFELEAHSRRKSKRQKIVCG